jgi:hypothetical protein
LLAELTVGSEGSSATAKKFRVWNYRCEREERTGGKFPRGALRKTEAKNAAAWTADPPCSSRDGVDGRALCPDAGAKPGRFSCVEFAGETL